LISLALNNFFNEPPYPLPLDSLAHNNKKVGETPTYKFLFEYRLSPAPNQPVIWEHSRCGWERLPEPSVPRSVLTEHSVLKYVVAWLQPAFALGTTDGHKSQRLHTD